MILNYAASEYIISFSLYTLPDRRNVLLKLDACTCVVSCRMPPLIHATYPLSSLLCTQRWNLSFVYGQLGNNKTAGAAVSFILWQPMMIRLAIIAMISYLYFQVCYNKPWNTYFSGSASIVLTSLVEHCMYTDSLFISWHVTTAYPSVLTHYNFRPDVLSEGLL